MPVQLCKFVKAVKEIQNKKDNAKQLDATPNEPKPQIAEQDDSRFVARDMCSRRDDQRSDDHLFDVSKYFLGALLDVLSVECEPLGSEIRHGFSLRQRSVSGRIGAERGCSNGDFGSLNTTTPRSRSKNPARLTLSCQSRLSALPVSLGSRRGPCLGCGFKRLLNLQRPI